MMNILITVAHPDDETIGMGGTIKKLSKNNEITLCVMTDGTSAQYDDKKMIKVRQDACRKAGKILGISKFHFLDFPDMKLDSISHVEINKELEKIIKIIKPTILYSTSYNDLNKDHQKVFESCSVISRPISSKIKQFICFEIGGRNKTPFNPNTYVDISKELPFKLKALNQYKTEIHPFPHQRSLKFIESLSHVRGVESGFKNAEAFQLIRNFIN
jgi:LmbE family N-acetylglucosaminyl deacetylase